MNPKLCKRLSMTGTPESNQITVGSDPGFSKTSVRDQAALLLSIADIAKSELVTNNLQLWKDSDDEEIPRFPLLLGASTSPSSVDKDSKTPKWLAPRTEALTDLINSQTVASLYPSNRIRAVSIDSPPQTLTLPSRRTPSPLSPVCNSTTPLVTPSPAVRKLKSLRLSAKHHLQEKEEEEESPRSFAENRSRQLQGAVPKGVPIKKILRRKFSWKNYPELEQFLIANREEYLRHSALNYTVQQKQYNNRLTDRLLELATEHGYVFEEKEFSFVTVRDRIRCYYKSYVQSAKKRGVLMGYAARKAGLLNEEDLSASGEIVDH